jgi:hypothetical protein
MSTSTEDTNVPETPIFDPFPETNTMPSGWDLSGLVPEPTPATTAPAIDETEA